MFNSKRLASKILVGNKTLAQKLLFPSQGLVKVMPYFFSAFVRGSRFSKEMNKTSEVSSFKLEGYSQIRIALSDTKSLNQILEMFEKDPFSFKKDEVIAALKQMSFLLRTTPAYEIENLENDERYISLSKKMNEYINDVEARNIEDVLSWIRKFTVAGIPTNITEENINLLFQKAVNLIEGNPGNFHQLVNVYYSLSFLKRNTESLCHRILTQLKTSPKLFTKYVALLLLTSCTQRESFNHYLLADYLQNNVHRVLDEFTLDEKCLAFENFARLELHLNPPKYRAPKINQVITEELSQSVEKLSSSSLLKIVQAYEFLPVSCSTYLLNRVKSSIIHKIQAKKLDSHVIIQFLEEVSRLRRNSRLEDHEYIIVYKEIINRIGKDPYFSQGKTLRRLLEIYLKSGVKFDPLVLKIQAKALELDQPLISTSFYRALLQTGVDIRKILESHHLHEISQNSPTNLVKIYIGYSALNDEAFNPKLDELREKILAATPLQLTKVITSISEAGIINTSIEKLIYEINDILIRTTKSLDSYVFFKTMFRSCQNSNIRKCWIEYAETYLKNLSKESVGKLIDAFFNFRDTHTFDQIILFHRILEIVDPKNIPFRKLLLAIKHERKYFLEISWLDVVFQKFLTNLTTWADLHKDDLRAFEVYGMLKRLEYSGAYIHPAPKLAKKLYELSKANQEEGASSIMNSFTFYLLDRGLLEYKDALQFYELTKNMKNSLLEPKAISYLLLINKNPSQELIEEAKESLRSLESRLTLSNSSKYILNTIAAIFRFPPELLEQNKERYLEHLREAIKDANHDSYTQIYESIPGQYLKDNISFYEPFMIELLQNYSYASNRILPGQIINILNKISLYGKLDNVAYNLIMVDIEKWLNSFKPEQYHMIIRYLVRLRLRETHLFDKILSKIISSPVNFISKLGEIAFDFFTINYNCEQAKQFIATFPFKDSLLRSSGMVSFACYVPILNLKNEKDILEVIFSRINESSVAFKKRTFFLYDFVRFVYKDKPEWTQTLKNLIPNFETEYQNYAALYKGPNKDRDFLRAHLEAMKVEFEEAYTLDGFTVDFYLPVQKILIKAVSKRQMDEAQTSFTGSIILTKRIMDTFDGYKPVFINMVEFRSIPDNKGRIHHLQACGIQGQLSSDKFIKIDPEDRLRFRELEYYFDEEEEAEQSLGRTEEDSQ